MFTDPLRLVTRVSEKDEEAEAETDTPADTDRTVGATASTERTDPAGGTASAPTTSSLESASEGFIAVEERLRPLSGPWHAVDVEVVPTDRVPEDYPRSYDTPEVLVLDLEAPEGGERVTVYLPYPVDDTITPESDLGRLLDRVDVPPDRFADLLGERIPVTREDDHLVVDLDVRTALGSPLAIYGVVGTYAVLLAAVALVLVGAGSLLASPAAVVVLLVASSVVLPVATYLDGLYLRTTGDWHHAPEFWALLVLVPGINLVTTAIYLLTRRGVL